MNPTEKAGRAIQGARNQFRGLFRTMAAEGGRWHVHAGSSGYVLAREGCEGLPDLPVVVPDVQAMTEDRMAARLFDDSRSRAFGA